MTKHRGAGGLAQLGEPIKHWKPIHDQVVALHMAGYSQETIASNTGVSIGHVKRILHDPRAQRAIQEARKRMLGRFMSGIQEKMVTLGVEAIKNIEQTIIDEVETGTKAKVHQDNVSFELLSRIGYGKRSDNAPPAKGGINLSPEAEERFLSAIERADQAREIHAEFKVVEADEEVGNGAEGSE